MLLFIGPMYSHDEVTELGALMGVKSDYLSPHQTGIDSRDVKPDIVHGTLCEHLVTL